MQDHKQIYLFIGGAPKCGTSALFNMLSQTNNFNVSNPKETFFFIDQDYILLNKKYNYHKNGLGAFLDYFATVDNKKIYLEATTHLLYQEKIPSIIAELSSKIVFILRDPAERIKSSFEYTKNNLAHFHENITFSKYVDFILNNNIQELTKYMPDSTSRWVLANELYLSDYQKHIDKWQKAIGKDRVLLIDYDDFKLEPLFTLDRILKFVNLQGLNSDINLTRTNETIGVKNKLFHRIIRKINKIIPNSSIKDIAKAFYFRFQKKEREWTLEDELALQKLKFYFKNNYKSIQELIKN